MKIYNHPKNKTGIPIVPMLDILTILLIFFIVHTQLKTQQNVLKLKLPQTQYLAGEKASDDMLLLEIGETGEIALQGKTLSEKELGNCVREMLADHPNMKVQVSAAEGASLGSLIQVTDILTSVGIDTPDLPVRIDFKPALQE